jgi:hypothetical protein
MTKALNIVCSIAVLWLFTGCTKTNNYYQTNDSPIPVIGHSFKVDFGVYVFKIDFLSETQMTFTELKGPDPGFTETVAITRREIRPNVFMVYWQEKDKTTVTHIEDFANGLVYTDITSPANEFSNLNGTLTLIQ